MNRLPGTIFRCTLAITLLLIAGARAEGVSTPGQYCPPLKTPENILEELSITLDQVAKAQHAMQNGNNAAADVALGRAANALTLASTYGAAARTRRLIDAALTPLFVQVAQGHKVKPAAFDKVLTLLRTALNAVFEQSYSAGNP